MAGTGKTARKETDRPAGASSSARNKKDPAPAKARAGTKSPAGGKVAAPKKKSSAPAKTRTGEKKTAGASTSARNKKDPGAAKTRAGSRKPAGAKAGTKHTAAKNDRSSPPPGLLFEIWPLSTLEQQQRAGYAMLILCAASIAGIGVWVAADSLHSIGHWALRATIRGACLALIGFCLWTVLCRRQAVSGALMIGAGAFGLLVYEAGSAWRVDRARDLANRTLLQLEAGRREVDNLSPVEKADPYIEAYAIMRDIYWELYLRCDDEMSRYRAYYEDYTADGAFLDVSRLTTKSDLRRSILQIEDLQHRLQRVEASRPDISDLLLTVSLLEVDELTRAAYADDLRTARDSFRTAMLESVEEERKTLRATRHALEALLDAQGRYRTEDGRLIFEHPEDAARFVGKAEPD